MSEKKAVRVISRSKKNGVLRIVIRSFSDARRRYVVSKKKTWACSCKIFIFRRGHLRKKFPELSDRQLNKLIAAFQCKHIRELA